MANDSYYFDHDYDARNDDKILEMRSVYKAEGYGIFWMLVETMATNADGGVKIALIGGLSLGYGVAKEWLIGFIQYCVNIELFYEKDGVVFSERMLGHKEMRELFKESGQRGAEKRWGKNRGANGPPNSKERKGKESKGKESKGDILGPPIPTMPTASDFNGLPEIKSGSAIQLLKITQGVDVAQQDITGLWEVFKVQNLTGKKFYQTEDDVYSHFLNWVKGQKIKKDGKGTTSTVGKEIKFDKL